MNLNVSFYWQESPEKGKANNRTREVLKRYNLENRIIGEKTIDEINCIEDWSVVNMQLEEERKKGLVFLKEALRK